MSRRSLAWLAVLVVACGPAAPQPQAPPPRPPAAPAPAAPAPDEPAAWIARLEALGDPREVDPVVARLEALGDPRAIPALGTAWIRHGRSPRILQAIIRLARPLTPAEAAAAHLTAYAQAGRPARWDEALPFLRRALDEIDEASPSTADSARHAATAAGEARLASAAPALVALAHRPVTRPIAGAQLAAVAALAALGKLSEERERATAALVAILEREPPPHPRHAGAGEHLEPARRAWHDHVGAAVNALAALGAEPATGPLVLAMYRYPDLRLQIRHALVSVGPAAAAELREILRGRHAAVNQLFRAAPLGRELGRDCGGGGDSSRGTAATCRPVSAMDFHAAMALGALRDASAVPELLAALARPAVPAYYVAGRDPGPTQHAAILDALRRIGAPEAAAPLRALWNDRKQGLATRAAAIEAYPFVAPPVPPAAALDELGRLAADGGAPDELRLEAAAAYARLARDPRAIAALEAIAKRYVDAAAQQRKRAERVRARAAAAELVVDSIESARRELDIARSVLFTITQDPGAPDEEVRQAYQVVEIAEAEWREAEAALRRRGQASWSPGPTAEYAARVARTLQIHVARIELALRCRDDLACYAASLGLTPDEAAARVWPYIKDISTWPDEDRRALADAAVEHAVLELGRRGPHAQEHTAALLALLTTERRRVHRSTTWAVRSPVLEVLLATERRRVHRSVLLALPRIAKLPCATCATQLDLVLERHLAKLELADSLEAWQLRAFFERAGAR